MHAGGGDLHGVLRAHRQKPPMVFAPTALMSAHIFICELALSWKLAFGKRNKINSLMLEIKEESYYEQQISKCDDNTLQNVSVTTLWLDISIYWWHVLAPTVSQWLAITAFTWQVSPLSTHLLLCTVHSVSLTEHTHTHTGTGVMDVLAG